METAEADGRPNEEAAAFRGGESEDWEALLTCTHPDLSGTRAPRLATAIVEGYRVG